MGVYRFNQYVRRRAYVVSVIVAAIFAVIPYASGVPDEAFSWLMRGIAAASIIIGVLHASMILEITPEGFCWRHLFFKRRLPFSSVRRIGIRKPGRYFERSYNGPRATVYKTTDIELLRECTKDAGGSSGSQWMRTRWLEPVERFENGPSLLAEIEKHGGKRVYYFKEDKLA
ncbi:hypothetical protein JXA12_02100 [Candidatus Woesearchaeota archaeon]|nr:hypothetical protein [Candidatus Woesearchaeota archaeon]